jgi:hypothetical protein
MMLTTKGTLIFLMADECQNSSWQVSALSSGISVRLTSHG